MNHVFTKEEDEFILKNYSNATNKEMSKMLNLTDSQIRHSSDCELKLDRKYNKFISYRNKFND